MLPIIPALILLILQGPAGIERMAWNGQLPGALDALHRHMASAPERRQVADEVALASLLAASSNRDFSRALIQLIALIDSPEDEQPRLTLEVEKRSVGAPCPRSIGRVTSGYLTSQRSRDGPTAFRV